MFLEKSAGNGWRYRLINSALMNYILRCTEQDYRLNCTFIVYLNVYYSYLPNKRTVRNKRAHGKIMPKKISVHMLFSSAYDMLNKSVHMGNFDPQN